MLMYFKYIKYMRIVFNYKIQITFVTKYVRCILNMYFNYYTTLVSSDNTDGSL